MNTECWMHPAVEVRSSPIDGRGLFAHSHIAEAEVVVRLGGSLVSLAELSALLAQGAAEGRYVDTITVDDDLHLVLPTKTPARFGNHSCEPNLWWRDEFTLVARRDIDPGEEITNDYGTSSVLPGFSMTCRCGAPTCRSAVTGEDWKREDLQARYADHWIPAALRKIAAAQMARSTR